MKKKCKRKHYPLVNPIEMAMKGAAYPTDELLQPVQDRERMAIERWCTGAATVEDWREVADILNVAETMSRGGVGVEVLAVCELVDAALSQAHARYQNTGRLGMTGPQLTALRDLWEYYDLQRKSITRTEYEGWIAKTRDRIQSAHPSVKVFL